MNAAGVDLLMTGIVVLSWLGSLFLSTLEKFIPDTMPTTKTFVQKSKVLVGMPIQIVELISNTIIDFAENLIIGAQLPNNVTEQFGLNDGPKLKKLFLVVYSLKNSYPIHACIFYPNIRVK